MGQAFPRGAEFSVCKILTHATVDIATVTIVFIHEQFAPSTDRIEVHGCSASCLFDRTHRKVAGVVSTSPRAVVDRFLSIQRTVPHCLGAGIGIWIQCTMAEHTDSGDGTAASALSIFAGGHLQNRRSLQLLVAVDRGRT